MKELMIRPAIWKYKTCEEFVKEFAINENDLILSNEYIYRPNFERFDLPCQVIFQEKYGKGEPTDEMTEAIAKDIKGDPERIIAIGGGTIIDISKLLALKEFTPVEDLFEGKTEPVKDKKLVIVPTTCGTGSEVTSVSVMSLLKKGTKKGLQRDELFADDAVLIPELLLSLPDYVFGTSSIDALIHAVESAISPKATESTKIFSYKAIDMILNGYKKVAEGGAETRKALSEDFLMASTYAGIAFSIAGTGGVHAMSYPFGARYHVPHGESNYCLFTAVLKEDMLYKQDGEIAVLNDFIAKILECDVKDVYDRLEELLDHIIKRKPLHEYGVTEEDLKDFAQSCYANQQRLLVNNFVPFTEEIIYSIYKKVY